MNHEDRQEHGAPGDGTGPSAVHPATLELPLTQPAVPDPATHPASAHPATGTMSAERLAAKALEARLLGGERKLRRREVAAGAGLSLLSARKLWRALGFPELR